jgi:hypothetical protein
MKHTPGPWRGYKDEGVYVGDGFEHPIFETGCGCCTETTLTEADARLIAAAPDLLAWLQFATKILGEMPGISNTWQVDQMRAAIAKATGEQQ